MLPTSLRTLLHHVQKKIPDAEIQSETGQILIPLEVNGKGYPTFVRVVEGSTLVQVLTFFPISLPNPSSGDLARLLHLLNKQLDMPGFGLDEQSGSVFYRVMLFTKEGELDPEFLDLAIQTCERVAQLFTESILGIASGVVSLDKVLAEAT